MKHRHNYNRILPDTVIDRVCLELFQTNTANIHKTDSMRFCMFWQSGDHQIHFSHKLVA